MSTDKEKLEKTKISSQVKHVPKDAQVIMSILKDLGIQEYDKRVINQLLEFTYRYVTCILDDAKVFANHARKKTIDLDDVKLATEVVLDKAFTCPPPRHILSKLAEVRNTMPLPPIKPHCGLRLPPDRYCLSACNYKLRAVNQPKKMVKSALEGRSTIKTQIKGANIGHVGISGAKRQTISAAKTQQVVTIPKPVIKFTTTARNVSIDSKSLVNSSISCQDSSMADLKMEVDGEATAVVSISNSSVSVLGGSLKREREEDEFEVVP
uniref:Transcription initiation factor TFIID subunit 9 n=1 Tax=Glossina pallidipes TaxID=7398 RepID=A0A1A9ZHV7_GLOPL